jgi:hypothetical protein
MEPDALSPGSSPYYDFVYNNESDVEPTYWPLIISQMQTKRAANELYTDDPSQYITYSGSWQSLLVAREKEGRYRNFSIRAYSGDSFNFYISIPSGELSTYYSGPVTSSGAYSVLTAYDLETDAQQTPVVFQAPDDNIRVYTLPSIQAVDWVRLHHESVVSGQAYRIYQFLPRTLIQVDDLEADVIDAVTIRVSDSIVVSADDLAPGSITGEKILAGTISGVLITPGTITANEINVTQLDALASNMGTLTVNSGLTLGQDGFLWTGYSKSGEYTLSKKGVRVVNSFTVGAEAYFPGGGSVVSFGDLDDAAKTVAYPPTYFTTPSGTLSNPLYTLSPYSGELNYFQIVANQFGKINQSQSAFNGYNADIRLGFSPDIVDDFNSNYSSFKIGVIASGYSLLSLYSRGYYTGLTPESSSINLENGETYITSTHRIQLNSPIIRSVDSFKVSKDISQSFPYIEMYSDVLSVDSTNFVYSKPSAGLGSPAVERLRITAEGQVSISGALTVSGNIVGTGVLQVSDGSVSAPTLSFRNDTDTGFYKAEDNAIRIATGGNFTGLFATNQIQMASGTEALPSYTFVNDNDTGMFRSAANAVALSAGGNQILTAAAAGQVLISTTNSNGQLTIEVPNGTARNLTTWRQFNDASAYINFVSNTITATTPIQTSALGTYYGKARVQVNGTVRWIALYNT